MTDENQPPVPPQQSTPPVPPAPPAQPQYQAAPPPAYGAPAPGYGGGAPAPVPGKTLGIVALIVSIAGIFIFYIVGPIVGLILSIIARKQSKAANVPNTPAKAGLIISIIVLVLQIIVGIIITVIAVAAISATVEACAELGPGFHEVGGVEYTCGTSGVDY